MKINMAALCDRATIREGLLHILGAGVTQTSLVLPSAPDLDFALLIRADDWTELAGRHTLTTTVTHENGTVVGTVEMGWESPVVDTNQVDQAVPQLPISVPLRHILLTEHGEHHVRVDVDGKELTSIHFTVVKGNVPGVTVQFR